VTTGFLPAVLLLIFLTNVFGDDNVVSGKITGMTGKGETFSEGDVFEAKVLIWPFLNQYEYHQEALKSFSLEEYVKLLKIKKMEFSKNNSELLEITGIFVLLKKPVTDELMWKNLDLVINFKMDAFVFSQTAGRINEPIVLSQPQDTKISAQYVISALLFMLVLLGSVFAIWRRKKLTRSLVPNDEKQFCKIILDHCDTREKIERIYQEKRKWEKYIKNLAVYDEYLKCINQIQYKKNWSSYELDLAVNTTKKLKESFMESERVV